MSNFLDRFDRPDSTLTIGNGWTNGAASANLAAFIASYPTYMKAAGIVGNTAQISTGILGGNFSFYRLINTIGDVTDAWSMTAKIVGTSKSGNDAWRLQIGQNGEYGTVGGYILAGLGPGLIGLYRDGGVQLSSFAASNEDGTIITLRVAPVYSGSTFSYNIIECYVNGSKLASVQDVNIQFTQDIYATVYIAASPNNIIGFDDIMVGDATLTLKSNGAEGLTDRTLSAGYCYVLPETDGGWNTRPDGSGASYSGMIDLTSGLPDNATSVPDVVLCAPGKLRADPLLAFAGV